MSASEKPLISFLLFTYNQERYVGEAVAGALAQTYSPLEIIVSDDHSTDRTFEIITSIANNYTGPHKLCVRRNSENLGIVGNYNAAVSMAASDILVLAAGDDISVPDRVSIVYDCFRLTPEAYFVSSDLNVIDEAGKHVRRSVVKSEDRSLGLWDFIDSERKELKWFINSPSSAYRKTLFSRFGPISERSGETFPVVFRCMLMNKKVFYLEEALVKYRVTENSTSVISPVGFDVESKKKLVKRKARFLDLYTYNIKQMRQDLGVALEAGLVETGDANKLRESLLRVERKLEGERDFYLNRGCGGFFRHVLFESSYSPKAKLLMLFEGGLVHYLYLSVKRWLVKFKNGRITLG